MPPFAESPLSPLPWRALAPLLLALAALYLLLPKPRKRPVVAGAVLGLAAVALAGILLIRSDAAPVAEIVLFYAFSTLAVIGAGAMLVQSNPARAAISFALVVMSVCGLFLLQGAPFLMAATIIIYAGAIIVTFLFVLMLAQQRGFSDADDRTREPFLASLTGFVLLGTILLAIDHACPDMRGFNQLAAKVDAAAEEDSLAAVDRVIGDREAFAAAWKDEERRRNGSRHGPALAAAITNLEAELNPARRDPNAVKLSLRELADVAHRIQQDDQPKPLPAANVAALGYSLYSEHLLPVELGGTLLLVATIGAIAITHRRSESRA
jgi:NADH-quinone oxidoreductase subunit J